MVYLPLFINVSDLRVLVVGGGKVGTKRALHFCRMGADVTVLSKAFSEELKAEKNVKRVEADASLITQVELSNYDIIVTATDNRDLNSSICTMAKNMHKLCNDPTDPAKSSVIFPVYYEDEDVGIAVTTFGKSSLTAELILDRIKDNVINDDYIKNLINAMYEVKKILKIKLNSPSNRFPLYRRIFDDAYFISLVKNGNIQDALRRAEEIIDGYVSASTC